ncbi:glucosidase [Spirosoma terrae]|uniref:Glucosidase n=1 Tax=Spirosoma terrae TaxID=1968276 RepID=A0A6L9LC29_9BACT|nr:glucosidase [Spirosoma terrae]NDU96038.1 glucosidase [Spirosoma terrae]
MQQEQQRLDQEWNKEANWYQWGPYVSDRQWGTVREDYSADGTAWAYLPHDMARSRTYRWGEDGIGGISDNTQTLCFALALWNGKDPYLKERLFGLSNGEGNHGEDVKELYYYLDNTPTHSYMRMLYKYPQAAFPYEKLRTENARRSLTEREYELLDTGLFDDNQYFDVFIEYAKADTNDLAIKITIHNRSEKAAPLSILPTLWFRNRWSFGLEKERPRIERMEASSDGVCQVRAMHERLGAYVLSFQTPEQVLMTENETNQQRVLGKENTSPFVKDAFHDAVTSRQYAPFNQQPDGSKCAAVYNVAVGAGESVEIRLRLHQQEIDSPLGESFNQLFASRQQESDDFYADLTTGLSPDDAQIKRQAWAGLLWSKQYYNYAVARWLKGDPGQPMPPPERWHSRNSDWQHVNAEHILLMPDKWEYPWFAAWDLAFHATALAPVDLRFAKEQLYLLADPNYQGTSGQLPSYEWDFSANNPPIRGGFAWLFFEQERLDTGVRDTGFLAIMFDRLRANYEWWSTRAGGKVSNLFQGGFLGLDNVSLFDRSEGIPSDGKLDQADATAWMATYTVYMMRITLELAKSDPETYEPISIYYFDRYVQIAKALQDIALLWITDDESNNGFSYDVLHLPSGESIPLALRSMVGLSNLFCVMTMSLEQAKAFPAFYGRVRGYIDEQKVEKSCYLVVEEDPEQDCMLFSLLSCDQLERLSSYLFNEAELLGPGGIRSLSKAYKQPYEQKIAGERYEIHYVPGESDSGMYGGNSNWRGPVWMPMNYLLVKALEEFGKYYGDQISVELPTGSGNWGNLSQAAEFLTQRMWSIIRADDQGKRPCYGNDAQYSKDPYFKDLILFFEHFDGDTSRGLGASHQTGWSAMLTVL